MTLKLLLALLLFATPASAAPNQFVYEFALDPRAAMQKYAGQTLEFRGEITSCVEALENVWTTQIDAGKVDVLAYVREEHAVGETVTLRGECVGFRQTGDRVTIILDNTPTASD